MSGVAACCALLGTALEPLAMCAVEQDAVVFPERAWSQERLLPCLAEIASTNPTFEEPPPQPDPNDGAPSNRARNQRCVAALALLPQRSHAEPLRPFATRVRQCCCSS